MALTLGTADQGLASGSAQPLLGLILNALPPWAHLGF